MSISSQKPYATSVADAPPENWVDRFAPEWSRPYLRLSRADRPIGTWLLLLPCWFGIGLGALQSSARLLDLWLILGSAIGAFLMRGAGCTWNDLTDHKIDEKVARTRSRPLPSGQVSRRQAVLWMVVQMGLSLLILLSFNRAAIWLGVLSLLPVAVYPFAKRFTWWPQVFLGIAFNWGILLVGAAHLGVLSFPLVLAYLGAIAWTIFYDTIYAFQDAEDDALIGVKSTALYFADKARAWLALFACISVLLLGLSLFASGARGLPGMLGLIGFGLHLGQQLWRFRPNDTALCLHLFRSNRNAGLIFCAGLVVAYFSS